MPQKVHENMRFQLKVLQSEQSNGMSAGEMHTAFDELQHLMNFNQSSSLAMAKTMEHL